MVETAPQRDVGGAPTPPVLRSKLARPAPLTDLVRRRTLTEAVVSSPVPITAIVAPAGYGKTSLACDIATSLDYDVAWLTIDAADNDDARFWVHLAAALDAVGIDVIGLEHALRHRSGSPVDEVIAAVESSDREIVLVLDDAHELSAAAVIEGCSRLLAQRPAAMRIVVTSRTDLDWSIPRLRTRGELAVLGIEELALRGELGIEALGAELDDGLLGPDEAAAIVERVDGWPAGLRLVKLALRTGRSGDDLLDLATGDQPSIARYLAGEVLDRRPLDEQEFLLATSILDELTPGACDAVSGGIGSLRRLRRLSADHVFTTMVDQRGPTFAYHRLLRGFLQSRLAERGAVAVAALHDRALSFFLHGRDTGAVVRHAVAAGKFDVALERLGEDYIELANQGRSGELWEWIGLIGAERVLADPVLSALPAWASLNLGRYEEIEPWLASFELLEQVTPQQRAEFGFHAAALRCHRDRHRGRLDAALCAVPAATLDALEAAGEQLVASTVLSAVGAALALSGEDRAAEDALRRAVEQGTAVGESSSVVLAYSYLGFVSDDPDEAVAHADSALGMVTTTELEQFHLPAMAWLVRGRVALGAGRVADAHDDLTRAIELARAARDPLVEALAMMVDVRRLHLLGRDDERRTALRAVERLLDSTTGTEWLHEQLRAAQRTTRFAPTDDAYLPLAARSLSERELAVLRLLPHDLTRKEVAAQLFVSENTVKTHLTSIRHKLLVKSRADIVERAKELGLLDGG